MNAVACVCVCVREQRRTHSARVSPSRCYVTCLPAVGPVVLGAEGSVCLTCVSLLLPTEKQLLAVSRYQRLLEVRNDGIA